MSLIDLAQAADAFKDALLPVPRDRGSLIAPGKKYLDGLEEIKTMYDLNL